MNPFTQLVIVLVVVCLVLVNVGAWLFWKEFRFDAPPAIGKPLVYASGMLTLMFLAFGAAVVGFHSLVTGA